MDQNQNAVGRDPLEAALEPWRDWLVGSLLPGVIHDLNNARYVVLGLAEQMVSENRAEREKSLVQLLESGDRGQCVIDALGLISRAPQHEPQWIDLGSVCGEAAGVARSLARRLFSDIRCDVQPRYVRADPMRLKTVLAGLGMTFGLLGGGSVQLRARRDEAPPLGSLRYASEREGVRVDYQRANLLAECPPIGTQCLEEVDAALNRILETWGGAVAFDMGAGTWSASVTIADAESAGSGGTGEEAISGAAAESKPRKVLLVSDAAADACLTELVLVECGHTVEHSAGLPEDATGLAAFDVVLWEAPPAPSPAQLESLKRAGATVGLLGRPPGDVALPMLPKPFGGRALLDFVTELIARS